MLSSKVEWPSKQIQLWALQCCSHSIWDKWNVKVAAPPHCWFLVNEQMYCTYHHCQSFCVCDCVCDTGCWTAVCDLSAQTFFGVQFLPMCNVFWGTFVHSCKIKMRRWLRLRSPVQYACTFYLNNNGVGFSPLKINPLVVLFTLCIPYHN